MEQLAIEDELCEVSKRLVRAAGRIYSVDGSGEVEFESAARALAQETEALVVVVNDISASAARKRMALGISDEENATIRAMLTDFTETSACNLQEHVVSLIHSSKAYLSTPTSFAPQQARHRSLEQAITDVQFLSTCAFLLLNPEEVHRGSGATMRLLSSAANVCTEANFLTTLRKHAKSRERNKNTVKSSGLDPNRGEDVPTAALQVAVKVFLRYSAPFCPSELQSELKDSVVALVRNARRVLERQERSTSALDQVKLELATLLQTLCLTAVRNARLHERTVEEAALASATSDSDATAGKHDVAVSSLDEAPTQQLDGEAAIQTALSHLNGQHQQNVMRSVVKLLDQEVPWFAEKWRSLSFEEACQLLSKLAPLLPQHSNRTALRSTPTIGSLLDNREAVIVPAGEDETERNAEAEKHQSQLLVKEEKWRKRKSLNVRLQREIQEAATASTTKLAAKAPACEGGEEMTGEGRSPSSNLQDQDQVTSQGAAPKRPRRRSCKSRTGKPQRDLRKTLVREPTVQALLSSELVQQQRLRNAEDISRFASLRSSDSSFQSIERTPSDKVIISKPVLNHKPSAMADIMTLLSSFRSLAQRVYSKPATPSKKTDTQQMILGVQSAGACLSELMAIASQKRISNSPPSWIDKVEVAAMKQCYLLLTMAKLEQVKADDVLLANAESRNLLRMLAYLDCAEAKLRHKLQVVTVLSESFALPIHIGNYSQQAFYKLQCCLIKFAQLSHELIRVSRTRNAFLDELAASKGGGYNEEDDLDLSEKEEEVWTEMTRTREKELTSSDDLVSLNELLVLLVSEEVLQDVEMVQMLLFTYPSVCPAPQLLEKLHELFRVPSRRSSTTRKRIQLGVLSFISLWLRRQREDFTPRMLKATIAIAEEGVDSEAAAAARSLCQLVSDCQQAPEALSAVTAELKALSASVRLIEPTFSFAQLDHASIARMLTLVDSRMFAAIMPSELLKLAWSKEKTRHLAPNVMSMIRRLNSVAHWVASMIVWPERMQERASVFSKFLEVAMDLFKLGNFNSLQTVLAALNMTAVQRLKHTRSHLSSAMLSKLGELNAVMKSGHNWKALRDAVAAAKPPVLPYLGLYLTDLTFTEDGNRDIIDGKINLKKRRMVYGIMKNLLQHQAVPYSFIIENPAFTLVSEVPALDEEQLYQCSLRREPRDIESRTLALLEKDKP